MNNALKTFTNGILKENPTFVLVLGMCPTLATTTSAINGMSMGLATMFVLVCSNIVISLLKNLIPDKVRIPAYITIIAGFVTVVQMLVKAFAPAINNSLGIYLPLIVVNCIILGRAEMFAGKNPVLPSILDGLGMGIGFTAALLCMGIIREFFGSGTLFGMQIIPVQILIFILPPGGFFVFGILIMLANKLNSRAGKKVKTSPCDGCPMSENCAEKSCEKTAKEATVNVD